MEDKLKIVKLNEPNSIINIINSLKTYGFAVITEHGLSKEKIDNNFKNWENFFHSKEKYKYTYDGENYKGYFSEKDVEIPIGHQKRDIKEFGHFYHPEYPELVSSSHSVLFNNIMSIFYSILDKLEDELPNSVTHKFPMRLVDTVKDIKRSCLRVNHYPPTKSDGRVRAASHTDISFMTLLVTDQQEGLEVLTKDNKWIPVPSEYNSMVINIGDQMEQITRGYFKSTYHRVVNPKKENNISRYSMPLFVHMHNHVQINDTQTMEEFLMNKEKDFGFEHKKDANRKFE